MTRKGTSWVDTEEERYGLARLAEAVTGGPAALRQLARELKLPRECFTFSNFFSRLIDPWRHDWAVCEAMEDYLREFYGLKQRFFTDGHNPIRMAGRILKNAATTIPWAMPGARKPLMVKPAVGSMTRFNVFVLERLLKVDTLGQFLDPNWVPGSAASGNAVGQQITADEKCVFTCLLAAAKSPGAASTQHWNIVGHFLGKQIDLLTRARKYMSEDPSVMPELPDEKVLRQLGLYLTLGDVASHIEVPSEGFWDFKQVFQPDRGLDRGDSSRPWSMKIVMGHGWSWQNYVAHLLAAKAAFEVCQRIAEFRYRTRTDKNWIRFRYIKNCRSPRCGKSFYTADASQVTCGRIRTRRAPEVSDCKRTWDCYQRWLRGRKHDPKTEWSSPDLKVGFLREFTPLGSQSPIFKSTLRP